MSYRPIWEASFDVAMDGGDKAVEFAELLNSIFKLKLVLVDWKEVSPSGFPEITIRGTRDQFLAWFREYYDTDGDAVGRIDEGESDASVWAKYAEEFSVTCIAA
jgi:hypothetical protein